MKRKKESGAQKEAPDPKGQELLHRNETKANVFAARVMLIMVFGECIMDIYSFMQPLEGSAATLHWILIEGIIAVVLISSAAVALRKPDKTWTRHLIIGALLFMCACSMLFFSYYSVLVMLFPPIFACRYFSGKYTVRVSVIGFAVFYIVAFLHVFCGFGLLDLNCVIPLQEVTLQEGMDPYTVISVSGVYDRAKYALYYIGDLMGYRMVSYIVVSIACTQIAEKGYSMIMERAESIAQEARIESELGMANRIQMDMLPAAFPQRSELEIFARMDPAREVGGDFYDCFFVDDTHLAVVIADVSGKGVPAALFMVVAKTLIKNHAQMGLSPAAVFTAVNKLLCENNESGMFVTAWMAILNTVTGELTYANAGHNFPLLRGADGKYSYLRCKPHLFLAGFETLRYEDHSLTMQKGDRLLLYTDGVTEAVDREDVLFGDDRLEEVMNTEKTLPVQEQLTVLRQHLAEYAHGAEQSDDITMLLLEYKGCSWKERTFPAVDDSLMEADAFMREELSAAGAEESLQDFFSVCLEEIYINIVHYAYENEPGSITVRIRYENDVFSISLIDQGIAFDPTQSSEPDITLHPSDRPIGGMGILLVKKRMDSVTYTREGDQNVLTMSKKLK